MAFLLAKALSRARLLFLDADDFTMTLQRRVGLEFNQKNLKKVSSSWFHLDHF